MPVLKEEATPPDWYGVYEVAKDVGDQPYRMLGHNIVEPYILYFWVPRISIAMQEIANAKRIRANHEKKLDAERNAGSRGRGSRGRPRRVI